MPNDMPWRTGNAPKPPTPAGSAATSAGIPPVSSRLKLFAAAADQSRKTGTSMSALGSGAASGYSPGPSSPEPPKPPSLAAPGAPKGAPGAASLVSSLQKKAMMHDPFFTAFSDEIIKTAAGRPMVTKVKAGATMLGRKVKNMASKAMKRAKGIRAQTKGGSGLKSTLKMKKKASEVLAKIAEGEDSDESAQDLLASIMSEAEARMNNSGNDQGYNEQMDGGTDDLSYGTGAGMQSKKRSMTTAELARARR